MDSIMMRHNFELMRYIGLLLFLYILICSCTPRTGDVSEDESDAAFAKMDLRDIFAGHSGQLVIYPESGGLQESYEELAGELVRGLRFQTIDKKPSDLVSASELDQAIVQLLGTPEHNSVIREFLDTLKIEVHPERMVIHQDTIHGKGLLLSLDWHPNPYNRRMPFRMFTGADESDLMNHLSSELRASRLGSQIHDIEVYKDGQRVYFASYDARWHIDASTIRTINTVSNDSGSVMGLDYEGNFAFEQEGMWSLWTQTIREINEQLSIEEVQSIRLIGYESAESKALATSDMSLAHVSDAGVHSITNEIYADQIPAAWLEAYLKLNRPDWPESTSAILSDYYAVKAFAKMKEISHHLHFAKLEIELKALFSPQDHQSRLLIQAMRYLLISELIQEYSMEEISRILTDGSHRSIDAAWQRMNDRAPKSNTRSIKALVRLGPGFTLAHEGYNVIDGYASAEAKKQIEKLTALGSKVIAIVPYSFMRKHDRIDKIPVVRHYVSENDASIATSLHHADENGLSTLLKPQIWLPRSWPGAIDFADPADWDRFFAQYRHWIYHYAILAELYSADMLAIGTEFQQATLKYPDQWRQIILDIRNIYKGYLTYAANWGDEIENIEFWSDLDYIGCNCYYPLSDKLDATDQDLQRGIDDMLSRLEALSKENGKPVLLTEIGYANIQAPWRQPHDEDLTDKISEEDQSRAIRLVSESLKSTDFIHGVYWWKWPSYGNYPLKKDRGFTPATKQAESIIEDCFREW